MRARTVFPLVLGVLGATLIGCSKEEAPATGGFAQERPENVRVLAVAATDLDEWLIVNGRLRAAQATDISCEESGVVNSVLADRGSAIREGEVVVELDRRLLDAQRRSAEAAATLRRYNEDRTRTLFEENSVSRQEMLKVHTEYEQAQQNAEIARLHYERAAIVAPFDGVIVDRYVEVGELVSPGQRVARVVDPSVLKLEGYATEAEVAWLQVGAPALVTATGLDTPMWARLGWVSVEASPSSGKFGLEIRIDNSEQRLRAGVLATAKVLKRRHRGVIAIPRDAVTEGQRGTVVYVADGDRAVAHPVRLGADQGAMVIALSGLKEGQELIVRGQRDVSDGSRIQITERSTRRDGSMAGDPPEVQEEGTLLPPADLWSPHALDTTDGSR